MSYVWVHSTSPFTVEMGAVPAGHDVDGAPIYVGRAYHNGDLLPAKVIPSRNVAYVSRAGQEIPTSQYETLTGNGFNWVASANGHVPEGAVVAGTQSDGEKLYVGRAQVQGSLTPGKVQASHGCIYIPFNGTEHRAQQYEVLVGPHFGSNINSSISSQMTSHVSSPIVSSFIERRSVEWMPTNSQAPLPAGAVLAGRDQDGSPIYIGRTQHEGDLLPAKVIPSKQVAYVSYGCHEHAKHQYDVLCNGNISWIPASNGHVPPNAVPAGHTSRGETLYVGRINYQGSLTVGKIQPSNHCLYIPFGGTEVKITDYEVLIEL